MVLLADSAPVKHACYGEQSARVHFELCLTPGAPYVGSGIYNVPYERPATASNCNETNPCASVFPESSSKDSTALIAGLVAGLAAAALLLALIVGLCCWRRRRQRASKAHKAQGVEAFDKHGDGYALDHAPAPHGAASRSHMHSFVHSTAEGMEHHDVPASQEWWGPPGAQSSMASASSSLQQTGPSANSANPASFVRSMPTGSASPSAHSGSRGLVSQRIAPPVNDATTISVGGLRFSLMSAATLTLQEPDLRDKVTTALQHMARADPPIVFANRYLLIDEQVQGGQAVVCFARDASHGATQYAIKCALAYSFTLCCAVCFLVQT